MLSRVSHASSLHEVDADRQLGRRKEPREDVVGIFLGGVLEEKGRADLGEVRRRVVMQQPETVESEVPNPKDTQRLASPARAKYPTRSPTLDGRQVVVPHKLRDEAFKWSPAINVLQHRRPQ